MSQDLKRLNAPKSWPVPRKSNIWVTSPNPGPHPADRSMPVLLIVREMLGLCDTAAEGTKILSSRQVLVDGKVVTDLKFPVGLMDVISMPKMGKSYRMLLDRKGKFGLVDLTAERSNWKLCRIENKTIINGGKVQLNLHDGRNLLVDKDTYKTGDVLKVELPSQKILDTYKLAPGNVAMVISGAHAGQIGVIEEYLEERSSAENLVRFKGGVLTVKDNVFVIGNKTPEIVLPEVSAI